MRNGKNISKFRDKAIVVLSSDIAMILLCVVGAAVGIMLGALSRKWLFGIVFAAASCTIFILAHFAAFISIPWQKRKQGTYDPENIIAISMKVAGGFGVFLGIVLGVRFYIHAERVGNPDSGFLFWVGVIIGIVLAVIFTISIAYILELLKKRAFERAVRENDQDALAASVFCGELGKKAIQHITDEQFFVDLLENKEVMKSYNHYEAQIETAISRISNEDILFKHAMTGNYFVAPLAADRLTDSSKLKEIVKQAVHPYARLAAFEKIEGDEDLSAHVALNDKAASLQEAAIGRIQNQSILYQYAKRCESHIDVRVTAALKILDPDQRRELYEILVKQITGRLRIERERMGAILSSRPSPPPAGNYSGGFSGACPLCGGSGVDAHFAPRQLQNVPPGVRYRPCPQCGGRGRVRIRQRPSIEDSRKLSQSLSNERMTGSSIAHYNDLLKQLEKLANPTDADPAVEE